MLSWRIKVQVVCGLLLFKLFISIHLYIIFSFYRTYGPIVAFCVFVYSLQYVAKSGEVWCEGGRIFLNPCSSLFSIHNAQYCLNLAVYFTPQYGDSFIEVFSFLPSPHLLDSSLVFIDFRSILNFLYDSEYISLILFTYQLALFIYLSTWSIFRS